MSARRGAQVFFVMGAPKSGTTWVQAIYNAHPQVSCLGEGHFVEFLAQPMSELLETYRKKLALVDERVYLGSAPYRPFSSAESLTWIRQMIGRMMQRAGANPDALWWGDKTPAYCRQIGALNQLFPLARFIHVVRDPRDVTVSALHHAKRAGVLVNTSDSGPLRQELVNNSIERWRHSIGAVSEWRERLGERLMEVQYRKLIDDPAEGIGRLFRHLEGIDVTEALIAQAAARTSFEAMSGGRKQGQVNDQSFFRAGTYGRYTDELTEHEIQLIEERLEPAMRDYGFA